MQLTAHEYVALEEALLDAFTNFDDLRRALRRASIPPNEIAPGALTAVVGEVISYAETRDRVPELIAGSSAVNPTNVALMELAAAVGAGPRPSTDRQPSDENALSSVRLELERMVDADRGIADLGRFSARLQEYVRRVCAVEVGKTSGTGFLIGPRTVLTNYHVVEQLIADDFPAKNVVLRFDYQRDRDGVVRNAGTEVGLDEDWLVDYSPYSQFDSNSYVEGTAPNADELDYAVLRLEKPLGSVPIAGDPNGPARGWVTPLPGTYSFPENSYLMVFQHPCHDPISFDSALDAVIRVVGNGLRVHYRVNTMPGSSGSPVVDRDLNLVALHHAGQPGSPDVWLPCHQQLTPAAYNQGIPIATIKRDLEASGAGWVFGEEAP
jgi:Trypsin-like peptidase domain/Effector-associated domain 1